MSSEKDTNESGEQGSVAEDMGPTDITIRNDLMQGKRHGVRRWVLRIAMALAILAPLIFVIAALGYRLGMFDLSTSLGSLSRKIGPILLVFGLIASIASVLLSWFVRPRKGILLSFVVLLVPLGGLIKLNSVRTTVSSVPFIHDITTDTENPPEFTQAIIERRNKTKGVNSLDYMQHKDNKGEHASILQSQSYPAITSVRRSESPDIVFREAAEIIGQQGWKVVTEDADNGIIEATDTSFWYGFKDDIILRIRESNNVGTVIDLRSVSRIGQSDLGANAERLEKLINLLKE